MANIAWSLTMRQTALLDLRVLASANPTTGGTYDVKVDFSTGGEVVTYPVAVTVRAAVVKGGQPLTGVVVTGVLKAPDGSSQAVNFLDDGTEGDHISEDGVYSAVVHYTMDGIYTVTVNVADSAGRAALAVAGQVFTPPSTRGSDNTANRPHTDPSFVCTCRLGPV